MLFVLDLVVASAIIFEVFFQFSFLILRITALVYFFFAVVGVRSELLVEFAADSLCVVYGFIVKDNGCVLEFWLVCFR